MPLDKIAFLETHARKNNSCWQSSGIIIILCKYYIFISDILIGFWICFLVGCYNIIQASQE